MFRDRTSGDLKTRSQLINEHPNTSLPASWNASTLDFLNVDPVLPGTKPTPNAFQSVVNNGASLDNGNYVMQYALNTMSLEDAQAKLTKQVRDMASNLRDGGIIYDTVEVSTTANAIGLLNGAKHKGRTTRKVVMRGGRAVMTQQAFDDLYGAINDYIQSVFDNEYDLLGAIEAAADIDDMLAIDVNSGWPSRDITSS